MANKKRCENCYYGHVYSKWEERGENCCVICLLRSDPFKGRIYQHSKDDKCKKWVKKDADEIQTR